MTSGSVRTRFTRQMRRSVQLLIGASGLLAICSAQTLPVITWQLVENRLTLHEPVIIRLSARNVSDKEAAMDFGANFKQGLRFRIIDPAGKTVVTPTFEPMGLHTLGAVQIPPGGLYARDFVVNDWYEFDGSGKYSIGVALRNPIRVGTESIPPPPEFFETISIDPRNETALRRKCEALVSILANPSLGADDVERVLVAANALGHVRDPIAVEYLIRATRAPVDINNGRAVGALAELGSAEALSALSEISRKTGYLADEAKRHLKQIQDLEQNPALRERLRIAKEAAAAEQKQ